MPQPTPDNPRRKHVPPMAPPPKHVPIRPKFESKPPPVNPRRVRGGERLPSGELTGAGSWAASRWQRMMEEASEGPALLEGLGYAREGQTKRITYAPGRVDASVQGRAFRPYSTTITFPIIAPDAWDKAVKALAEGSVYAAKLLAGEMPRNIEDVFDPLELKLFPSAPADVRVTCTCGHPQTPRAEGGPGWCKHACCVAAFIGAKFSEDPFVIFTLRGLEPSDLMDRLRQRRAVVGAAAGATPIYQQRVQEASEVRLPSLEEAVDDFWELGPGAADIDLSISPAPVKHPLLRRLGSSPWSGPSEFPLVGLLASCYETISQAALRESETK
ncbi:MAG TPA: hypothetical protein VD971_06335 [Phycisphaerales bacterium]|nr:hypothetical protein [Phycisphaerales bacterium]